MWSISSPSPCGPTRSAGTKEETRRRVLELMDEVGIPREFLRRYPHQFSGGQRQRIGIARALALQPKLIVCDEPVSALDVSIQSQVINLLEDLQEQYGLTYLFISHDLSVVRHISDRVCVMFLGCICELGNTAEIYDTPMHPYTRFLLDSVPKPDPKLRDDGRELLTGDIPSPVDPPSGCRFRTRAPTQRRSAGWSARNCGTLAGRQGGLATTRWNHKHRCRRIWFLRQCCLPGRRYNVRNYDQNGRPSGCFRHYGHHDRRPPGHGGAQRLYHGRRGVCGRPHPGRMDLR